MCVFDVQCVTPLSSPHVLLVSCCKTTVVRFSGKRTVCPDPSDSHSLISVPPLAFFDRFIFFSLPSIFQAISLPLGQDSAARYRDERADSKFTTVIA